MVQGSQEAHDAVGTRVDAAELSLPDLLDHLPAMVAFYGADLRNGYANRAYADWFASTPDELRGRHMREVLGMDLYELNVAYAHGALAGEQQSFERTAPDGDGHLRYIQATYIPHQVGDLVAGFVVMVSEISTRVRAEKAVQDSIRQIALLEERQRIAADLHDLVIQRLFAAGLDLNAALRPGADSLERVSAAAVGVDEAIRELRRSIHSLRELMVPTQVPVSVEKIVSNAARVLGFTPTVTYTGALDLVPQDAVQDLLAVLNEALSNVSRHAGATAVSITLACSEKDVLLQVADDGRGMLVAERHSGLANMRRRAERHGGELLCGSNHPTGTVLSWVIPVS